MKELQVEARNKHHGAGGFFSRLDIKHLFLKGLTYWERSLDLSRLHSKEEKLIREVTSDSSSFVLVNNQCLKTRVEHSTVKAGGVTHSNT